MTDLDSRSWIMQADGSSWGWLDVIAGEQSPTSAKMITLPPGVWAVSGVWQGNFDAEIRYQEAGGVVTLGGVIPAQANDRPGFFALQLPLNRNTSVHIRPRGSATAGARATFTAVLFPIFSGGGVGFSGLLFSWWPPGGRDERATRPHYATVMCASIPRSGQLPTTHSTIRHHASARWCHNGANPMGRRCTPNRVPRHRRWGADRSMGRQSGSPHKRAVQVLPTRCISTHSTSHSGLPNQCSRLRQEAGRQPHPNQHLTSRVVRV